MPNDRGAELKVRTKAFALRVLKLVARLPKVNESGIIRNQLGRAGTSVGANYRAACKGRSKAEFVAKIGVVEEEADECCFWLELIMEGGFMKPELVQPLWDEANELVRIMAASRRPALSS